MDWTTVAKLIAPLAPAAGSILGGLIPFPGASIIGQKFGEVIARQFGVPNTPAAVTGAIAGSTNEVVLAKINQAMVVARAEIDGFVEIEKAWAEVAKESVIQVNATMRAELLNQHWFFTGWRPAAGWVFDVYMAAFGALLMWATVRAILVSPDPLKTLAEAWPIFAAYFGILAAMVGVYVVGRSQEKISKSVEVPTAAVPAVKPVGKK